MTDTAGQVATPGHLLSNKLYDVLKIIALVILPALGTLYYTLATIWGLPAAEQIVGTIVAVDTFLGVVIKIGDVSYNNSESRFDGNISVERNADNSGGFVNLDMKKQDPYEVVHGKNEVVLKVASPEHGRG